ncbi:MAG: sodium-dependent transporter [Legionellales bacterium]|nr:sodium-dependent transporter [Legionellales bacterium]
MNDPPKSLHGQWSSGLAFTLAATAAAVGLGNIWKFPYMAGANGGGAFVLVYLLCVILIGIPLLMAEITLGRRGRQNPAFSMRYNAITGHHSRHWQWVGGLIIAAGFLIVTYYSVIAGWALDYAYQAALNHFADASPQAIQQLFANLVSNPWKLILWHSFILIGSTIAIGLGVERGLERSVWLMFPTMLILLIIIVGYAAYMGDFRQGFQFLFAPDFSKLTTQGVLLALGQAFFTLSIATGSIMMYGAYVPTRVSIPRVSCFIAGADTLIALVSGLAIFPIVFAYHLDPAQGPGLIFETLPIAFGQMPLGRLVGTLFFIMLVFAAFTSVISLLEPTVAFLIERFRLRRTIAAGLTCFTAWFIGLGTVLSFNHWQNFEVLDFNFFESVDFLTANLMLPLGGLCISIFIAWRFNQTSLAHELHWRHRWSLIILRGLLGILSPLVIVLIFAHALYS